MKISTKQYAQTLFELTQDKSDNEIDGVIVKFAELLKKNRKMKLLSDIIKKFNEIYNKKNGIVEAEVISSRELDEGQLEKLKSFLKEKYQSKKTILKNSIDKNIKGGIIIKVSDEVLDGSVAGKLMRLRKELAK